MIEGYLSFFFLPVYIIDVLVTINCLFSLGTYNVQLTESEYRRKKRGKFEIMSREEEKDDYIIDVSISITLFLSI